MPYTWVHNWTVCKPINYCQTKAEFAWWSLSLPHRTWVAMSMSCVVDIDWGKEIKKTKITIKTKIKITSVYEGSALCVMIFFNERIGYLGFIAMSKIFGSQSCLSPCMIYYSATHLTCPLNITMLVLCCLSDSDSQPTTGSGSALSSPNDLLGTPASNDLTKA